MRSFAIRRGAFFVDVWQAVLRSSIVGGAAEALCAAYSDQPCSVVEDALVAAVSRALAAEKLSPDSVVCDVDYGAACPEGVFVARSGFSVG